MPSLISSDIALLAAEAAIDIDNMLSGKEFDREATKRLAIFLSNLIGVDTKTDAERPRIEPNTFLILNTALRETGITAVTLGELLREVEDISRFLSSPNPKAWARFFNWQTGKFCLALSSAILAELNNRDAKSM